MRSHSKTNAKAAKIATSILLAAGLVATGTSLLPVATAFAEEVSSIKKYYTDSSSFEEHTKFASAVNTRLAEESYILMKNKDSMLPFGSAVRNVSVFGTRSDNLQYGGSGSGSSNSAGAKTIRDSLEAVGYNMNTKLVDMYASVSDTVEQPVDWLKPAEDSYKLYGDAAIIILSRSGSEFNDSALHNVAGHQDASDHILMLQDNERALINHVSERFGKVVVVLNTPNPMEVAEIEDNENVQGILWMGLPGMDGAMALGKILKGEINPSGRTVDMWAANQKKDPVWYNLSSNSQHNLVDGKYTPLNYVHGPDGETYTTSFNKQYVTLDYEEGIYMGYKWYETAAADGVLDKIPGYEADKATIPADKNGDTYYNRSTGVIYPFGFGLSYTTFQWDIVKSNAGQLKKDGKIEISVKVTNTGDVAGMDVVQLYSTPQYYKGGIEKAAANLIAFDKTHVLDPGKSEIVKFSVSAQDLASFDYNDANENGFYGYELEAGKIDVTLRKNSHEVVGEALTYTVPQATTNAAKVGKTGFIFDTDSLTGNPISLQFSDDGEENAWQYNTSRDERVTKTTLEYMSRADFIKTFPDVPTIDDLTYTQQALDFLDSQAYKWSYMDQETDPWYKTDSDIPKTWTQAGEDDVAARVNGKTKIQLVDMIGVDINDPKWVEFVNQLTYAEMVELCASGRFSTIAMDSIGKPATIDNDGPTQLKGGNKNGGQGYAFVAPVCVASTWDTELAELQGQVYGNDSLYIGTSGWYGPALNTHRHPLSGRNFEYYSQDGLQGGKIAASVIRGATSKGVHVYMKHCFANDQEWGRDVSGGLITWFSEQSAREIYLKQFEICFKEGNANGVMCAFNRYGLMPSFDYRLHNDIFREEYGYNGFSVTDMYSIGYCEAGPGNTLVRCGIIPLGSVANERPISGRGIDGVWDDAKQAVMVAANAEEVEAGVNSMKSATQWYAVRTTATKILYTVANSNAMQNGYDTSSVQYEKSYDVTYGESVNLSFAIDKAAFKADSDTPITYFATDLPKGLTINKMTGAVTGTVEDMGTVEATIKVIADGWVEVSNKVTFNLKPNAEAKVGDELNILLAQYKVGDRYNNRYTISAVENTLVGEIPGLALNADGYLTGKVTTPGSYIVSVEQKITYPGWSGDSTVTIKKGVAIVVTGEGQVEIEKEIVSVTPIEGGYRITFSDETYIDIMNGKDGAQGPQGEKGETGATGPQGEKGDKGDTGATGPKGDTGAQGPQGEKGDKGDTGATGAPGEKGEAGCAGSVEGTAILAITGIAALVACAGVLVLRKKKD